MLEQDAFLTLTDFVRHRISEAGKLERRKAREEEKAAKREVYKLKTNGQWKVARDTVKDKVTKPFEAVRRRRAGPEGQFKGSILSC